MEFPYVPMTYVERTILAMALFGVAAGSIGLAYMMWVFARAVGMI